MNQGYMNKADRDFEFSRVCPLCGSNVYFSKYGNNFRCLGEEGDCELAKERNAYEYTENEKYSDENRETVKNYLIDYMNHE